MLTATPPFEPQDRPVSGRRSGLEGICLAHGAAPTSPYTGLSCFLPYRDAQPRCSNGGGTQSESMNQISGCFAARQPMFRAEPGPRPSPLKQVTSNSATILAVSSVEPSSTKIISRSELEPVSASAVADARHKRIVRAQLRPGTTRVTESVVMLRRVYRFRTVWPRTWTDAKSVLMWHRAAGDPSDAARPLCFAFPRVLDLDFPDQLTVVV